MEIRPTTENDIVGLQRVLKGTDLFPSEMLPDMLRGSLAEDDSSDIWLTCEVNGKPIGFCYVVSEEMAEGAWNMRAIAVLPSEQGGGCGGSLVQHLEAKLTEQGQRILIADTSGTENFARTRAFYVSNGYTEESRIRDFWAAGDDKVTFWKSLS